MFRISFKAVFMWVDFMPELFEKIMKVNHRVVILTLIMLVAFDVALQYTILPSYLNPVKGQSDSEVIEAPAIRRLPADDFNTLALWKNQMAKEDGFKVVFLGDSVVHGSGVASEKETIPAYFARQMKILVPTKDVKVYSFTLPGCTPEDTYHIFNYIADVQPDLVIYDVNIGWFGAEAPMSHPRLSKMLNANTVKVSRNVTTDSKPPKLDPDEALEKVVNDQWSLYRNRIFLNYLWFGKPLKERISVKKQTNGAENREITSLTMDKSAYKPWYTKNWDVLKKTQGKLGGVNLDANNHHWIMYNKFTATLRQNQINSVFFMVPRNRTLYEKYNLLDEKLLEQRQTQLALVAQKQGIKVFDYTYTLEDKRFADTVHLLAPGNRIIAEQLAWDIVESGIIK